MDNETKSFSTHLVTASACTRIATLLNSFAGTEKINKLQRLEGFGRDTALNFYSQQLVSTLVVLLALQTSTCKLVVLLALQLYCHSYHAI